MIQSPIIKHRGAIFPENVTRDISTGNYHFLQDQKMGFYLSYETEHFQFHAVDRFASFPLFYTTTVDGEPVVSENIEDLLPYLSEIKFDAIGYYGTGGFMKGERSYRTPFMGIERIEPGYYLEYKNKETKLHCYWSFAQFINKPVFQGSFNEACEELGYLIKQAVKRCYEFAPTAELHLSGGLDSGSIAALFCQLSSDNPIAHIRIMKNAPLDGEQYESGYISAYQAHYSNLEVKSHDFSYEQYNTQSLFADAGNWYCASKSNVECTILEGVKKRSKFILTGLGGDELASYGGHTHNSPYTIHNDWQAKWFLRFNNVKGRWRQQLRACLKKDINFIDTYNSAKLWKGYLDYSWWYTEDFKTIVNERLQHPSLIPAYYPASYNYRLDTLNRSFFTYRSDLWNYIGQHHGIDYLHPFLDADLVTFCISLPRKIYRGLQRREMFKKALQKDIPTVLLEGGKRPLFLPDLNREELLSKLKIAKNNIDDYVSTFAHSVYDFKKIKILLTQYLRIINNTSETHTQTYDAVTMRLRNINFLIVHAYYLNKQF